MGDKHLSSQFDSELSSVSSRVMEMGGLVESQIRTAVYSLAELSAEAHGLAAEPTEANVKTLREKEADIDHEAAAVWDIAATELKDIQSSLADLR